MKRIAVIGMLAAVLLIPCAAHADDVDVVVIDALPTPTPAAAEQMPPELIPVVTPRPELPEYEYDAADMRCLSRAIWSITPANPTRDTKLALCEVVQNRADDASGSYRDDVRSVLLQPGEFRDYDADAHRSAANDEIADYAMRTWMHAQLTGDRTYRLTPADGLMIGDFYTIHGTNYVRILNREGYVVYDSGAGK